VSVLPLTVAEPVVNDTVTLAVELGKTTVAMQV
jgi:hypothetical protein